MWSEGSGSQGGGQRVEVHRQLLGGRDRGGQLDRSVGGGGLVEADHDVQHVGGQVPGEPVGRPARSARAISRVPRPRPPTGPSGSCSDQVAAPRRALRVGPENWLGSGRARVPSEPVSSSTWGRSIASSKENWPVALAPEAKRSSPSTRVGTSTVKDSPARGPEPMMRLGAACEPTAETEATGP